jgi:SAM-dependent methyltransferase
MIDDEVMDDLTDPLGPDQHLDPDVAAQYDAAHSGHFDAELVAGTVEVLAGLADGGTAVEFAVGTGRVALPLAARGVPVHGIDLSAPMLDVLRTKPGADSLAITLGDMTTTTVCDDASLVYLVFNTIGNLRTQREQVACFRNAAAHLRPGGRFVVETVVPRLHRLATGESRLVYDHSPGHIGIDEYVDRVGQILVSHHHYIDGGSVRSVSGAFRYVWPSELDLMAEIVGMTLESRWSSWQREPFTDDSTSHVSVWRTSE